MPLHLFTHHEITGGDGVKHRLGSRVVYQYTDASGDPAPSLGLLCGIAEDEERDNELCAFIRRYHTHPTKSNELMLDWTSRGQVKVRGVMLRGDMQFSVVSSDVEGPAGGAVFVCDCALVDDGDPATGNTKIIPLADAPQCWSDKFTIDLSNLDAVLSTRPDLRVLRIFVTNFNDDFGFYSKVFHKTKGR
jgi:hypothetical protein